MKSYVHNIRCDECGKLYESGSIIPARHYNSFDSYCCSGCGTTREFVDCYEFWVSVGVWYKPWTWCKGEWQEVR
ncbi:hypothetical protein vBVpaMR16F_152 [Vibrio phage vB_VpaM_R16F]|nr:hypothetical protein vBVpaMR16F_152 [Vibrio phage vB_VpaM_R16F]